MGRLLIKKKLLQKKSDIDQHKFVENQGETTEEETKAIRKRLDKTKDQITKLQRKAKVMMDTVQSYKE